MIRSIVVASLFAITPVAASASLVVNGDFENGLTGWASTGVVNAVLGAAYADGIGTAATPAQRANTYVFFGGGNFTGTNTLSQSFATIAGRTYSYSFDALAVGSGVQDLSFDFGGQGGTASLVSANNFSVFSTITGSFVASGPSSTVAFTNVSSFDNIDVVIDNVAVNSVTVPEAATWAMLIAGFGLVGAASRRRRAIAA